MYGARELYTVQPKSNPYIFRHNSTKTLCTNISFALIVIFSHLTPHGPVSPMSQDLFTRHHSAYEAALNLRSRFIYMPAIGLGERAKALNPTRRQLLKVDFECTVGSVCAHEYVAIVVRYSSPHLL